MHWYGCRPTISVSKLLVRTALANQMEAKFIQYSDSLPRLQDWQIAHVRQLQVECPQNGNLVLGEALLEPIPK